MSSFVSLEPGMMIWLWVTFGVLFILLSRFAWKPILAAIEGREEHVRNTLDSADKANEEAQALLAKHQQMMAEAEARAQQIMRDSKEAAERLRNDLQSKAQEQAQALLERARGEIETQKAAALKELQSTVADLSLRISEKLLAEQLDANKQKKVIDRIIATELREN
jgi:F-type H+-transporting ATPase subunit b